MTAESREYQEQYIPAGQQLEQYFKLVYLFNGINILLYNFLRQFEILYCITFVVNKNVLITPGHFYYIF